MNSISLPYNGEKKHSFSAGNFKRDGKSICILSKYIQEYRSANGKLLCLNDNRGRQIVFSLNTNDFPPVRTIWREMLLLKKRQKFGLHYKMQKKKSLP